MTPSKPKPRKPRRTKEVILSEILAVVAKHGLGPASLQRLIDFLVACGLYFTVGGRPSGLTGRLIRELLARRSLQERSGKR